MRVTVPMPQSLNELESVSRKHFGKTGGKMKMYHQGETRIKHAGHFKNVQDNDHVVVRCSSGPGNFTQNMTTTHSSDFVKHPLEQRRPMTPQVMSGKSPPFQGRSCYNNDFIEHPIRLEDSVKPQSTWQPSNMPMTGRSTYHDNYPWHDATPEKPIRRGYDSTPAPPFNGQSSYKQDYVKHDVRPQTSARSIREPLAENVPFNGSTTYFDDFKKHPMMSSPQRAQQQPRFPSPPFAGNSEYKQQYIEKQNGRGPLIHLMPQRRGSRGSQLSVSTPSSM